MRPPAAVAHRPRARDLFIHVAKNVAGPDLASDAARAGSAPA